MNVSLYKELTCVGCGVIHLKTTDFATCVFFHIAVHHAVGVFPLGKSSLTLFFCLFVE